MHAKMYNVSHKIGKNDTSIEAQETCVKLTILIRIIHSLLTREIK